MLLALLLSLSLAAPAVTGVVRDSSGGAIPGATVTIQTPSGAEQQQTVTGPDGRFTFETAPSGESVIVVRAGGFGEKRMPLSQNVEIEVVLTPAALLETVVVTPTRSEQRLGDLPASVSVLSSERIEMSPALTSDDVLRQIPSFSLFRRANAIAAQPTTQGVSLRGIGPSGQSRTLVLLDGVPFNDPFGGWVYWTRVPLESVDRIEVTEDSASSLYGNIAMGGVINIVSTRPTRRMIEMKPQYSNKNSPKFDFLATDRWNDLGVAVDGSFFNTDGYPIVTTEAGPIDNNANVEYQNIAARLEYVPNDHFSGFFRAGYFSEDRNNAKVGELNDTRWTTISGGARARLSDGSDLQGRIFGDIQNAHFNFLAVTNPATTRNLVRLATDQRVPTNSVGGMAQWTKIFGTKHAFSAGTDYRWVDGDSEEDGYVPTVPTVIVGVTQQATLSVQRVSGGSQRSAGVFLQDVFTPTPKLTLTLNARLDHWINYDGHFLETMVSTGLPTANNKPTLPDKDSTVVSPRIAALYHLTDKITAWGAYNTGFRAPTLTELYRQFSVGAITTRPNDQLNPERLKGGELGFNVAPASNLTARVTWFDNRIEDPVSNVTLSTTSAQKRNLGHTRIYGIQTDVEYLLGPDWRVSAAYIYDHARVTDGGEVPTLTGKTLAQVPENRGSIQIAYSNRKYANVSLGIQALGRQFNDDQNVQFIPGPTRIAAGYDDNGEIGLPGYTAVDLMVSHDFNSNLQAFFGTQNMFNQVFFVQTNPSTEGSPRIMSGGVRIRWAAR